VTQSQLDRAVALATGESVHTVRHLGFGLLPGPAGDLEPEDLRLAVDCPFCGHACALADGRDGLPAMAECRSCDVCYEYAVNEVYAAGSAALAAGPAVRAVIWT